LWKRVGGVNFNMRVCFVLYCIDFLWFGLVVVGFERLRCVVGLWFCGFVDSSLCFISWEGGVVMGI
jgi:hypothetical protein